MTLEVEEVEGIVSLEDILIVVFVTLLKLKLNVGFLEQWFVRTTETETESTVLLNLSAISDDAKLPPHSVPNFLLFFIIIINGHSLPVFSLFCIALTFENYKWYFFLWNFGFD